MLRRLIKTKVASLMLAAFCASTALAQQAPTSQAFTPVQLAFLKAETKKANDAFVKQAAQAAGVSEAQVSRALPDEKRITDRMVRLISALEKDLRRPLTDEQKAAITSAEDARKKALSDAQTAARKK